MDHVLTLVAGSGASPLDHDGLASWRERLRNAGAETSPPRWLDPGRAVDLTLDRVIPREKLEAIFDSVPLDWALQRQVGRRKKLLLADMESTMIAQEMIDEIAEAAALGPQIAEITRRAMAGELEFAGALRERVAQFAGLPANLLAKVSHRITLNPGAAILVQTMRHHGAYCALVSGGFTYFTQQVSAACGFHEERANTLIVENDRITGRVQDPILGPEAKLQALQELIAAKGLKPDQVCAVGDGANDLTMLSAAGLGVAYHGKPAVRAAARFRIDHGDLTSLLFFQGYHRDEMVTSR